MAEREAIAVEMGLTEPGERLSPRLQRKTAEVITHMEAETAVTALAEAAEIAVETGFAQPISETYKALIAADLPESAAAQVVAAIAPAIWRANQGAAHAR
ncbi:hypothetical protein [Rhodococcus globerulus]|nr:hypothetical protein [Rhodococcus globerulus]